MTYAAAVMTAQPQRQPPRPPRDEPLVPQRRLPAPARPGCDRRSSPRKCDAWRTSDNRPLCFHCGEAGNILRHCLYRRIGLRGFAINAPRPRFGQRPQEIDEYLRLEEYTPNRFSRSPSPSTSRFASPRRSYAAAAIIDLRSKLITLSMNEAIASMKTRENHVSLSVLEEEVSVPPRSSVIVTVGATKSFNAEAIIEGNMQLRLDRGIGIARGIAHLRNGQAVVLLTNFSEEYRHINRGTMIAFFDEISDVRDSFALSDPSAEDSPGQENSPTFDINPALHRNRQDQIRNLLQTYSPYRVSPRERQAIRDQVEQMLRDDVIQPSNSPWAAPVVLVRKKDGALQFCLDYRRLNNITKKYVYPLPRIDGTLDRLCNSKYFSSMDLKSGYWQTEADERDREKTAFITPDGLFEFKAEANYSTTEKECLAIIWAMSKFRRYHYGRPFKVVSDHHALCWLANLKDPSGRFARWSLRLQEFDVTVVYKSGRKHSDADCLSRSPVDATPPDDDEDVFLGPISPSSFAQQQRSDPDLKGLIEYLEGKVLVKNFTANKTAYLLVVPTCLREEVLQASHDEPTAGHLGFTRTLHRIQDKYYRPRLSADVAHYVKTCRDCQRRKTPPTRPAGFLSPVEPPTRLFQQIGMHMLGPSPTSTSGNKWIIIATDYLTRYAEAKALPNGTAAEVAKFFVECILIRHGSPDVLITERGTAFTAELTQAILCYSQTSHRRTTAYHPQTNGLTERLNKTIADMLAMYVDAEHKTSNVNLPYVVFA
ncbi:hypothetical protein V5799_003195 [Amblyomma americanum]|uniref:RNA-directed DNA polymerase n=1 Tax=Amblyomma americanum TaxID=6943 RepID=A0AAQ4D9N2_AMBAM